VADLVSPVPMKSSWKVLVGSAAGIAALAATAWIGMFFYWHFRVAREIRILRTKKSANYSDTTTDQLAAASALRVLGCRALPQLIGALHPLERAGFLNAASFTIAQQAGWLDRGSEEETWDKQNARTIEWSILPHDSDETKRRKILLMQEWWFGHAPVHPWWRIWSSPCRT
jgi:hypothetical protein